MEIEMRIFIILMVAKYGMTEKNATRNNIITGVTTKTDANITTECTTHDSKTEHKEHCEEETLDITCPNGAVIIFHDANFGRSSLKACVKFIWDEHRNCFTNNKTLAILRQRCNQTSCCRVFVSNDVFRNSRECRVNMSDDLFPDFPLTPYLDVKYSCQHKVCKEFVFVRKYLEQTKSINTYSTSTSHNTNIGNVSSEKCVIYIFVGSILIFLTIIIISGYIVTRRQLKRRSRNVLPCPDVATNTVPATSNINLPLVTKNEDFTYEEIVELQQRHNTDSHDKDGHPIPVQTRSSKDMDGNSGNHGNRMKLKDEQKDYINTNTYQPLNHDRHSIPHIYSTTQL